MATKQDKQARREQDGGMRCDSKRWYSVFCVAIESCRAHDAEPSAALRPAAYTARRFLEADVPPRPRLCACSLQNPQSKLSLFPSLNSSLKQSQSKLPHRKGAPALFLLLLALGESPRTRHGFSRGMRKRAAIDASTPAAYTPVPSFSLPWRWFLSPFALFMCAVGLVAGLLLGRLACKGDEDMSPRLGNGAGLRVLLAS